MAAHSTTEGWMSRWFLSKEDTSTATQNVIDREAFEAEAMPHLNDIHRTAIRILGDPARGDDVTQEVFLQAWKSFHRFEPGTNCRAWLFKILFHCIHHHRRKWFRFPQLKENEEFLADNLVAATPVPEQL